MEGAASSHVKQSSGIRGASGKGVARSDMWGGIVARDCGLEEDNTSFAAYRVSQI